MQHFLTEHLPSKTHARYKINSNTKRRQFGNLPITGNWCIFMATTAEIFKKWFFPVITVVAALGVAVSGLFIGTWLSEQVSQLGRPSGVKDYAAIMWKHILHLSTPVPYFMLAVVISFLGSIEVLLNRYRYGQNDELRSLLRAETQEHGESQRNYFDSLSEALRYLLAGEHVGFDETCRVTIYRLQNHSPEFLKRIFRFSNHNAYDAEGRFQIPISEGLVGVAWRNHGSVDYEYLGEPDGAAEHLRDFLAACGGKVPECLLSMPSKCFVIRAIEDLDSRRRIAVVVFESTENGKLKPESIDKLFAREGMPLCRLVKHRGALDGKLNPDMSVVQA